MADSPYVADDSLPKTVDSFSLEPGLRKQSLHMQTVLMYVTNVIEANSRTGL